MSSARTMRLGSAVVASIAMTSIVPTGAGATGHLTPTAAVAGHCAAWNTTNRVKRDVLLRRVFARDGVYNDPTPAYVTGRAALSDEIARVQRKYPGARFHCSPPQVHHSAMRVSWVFSRPDGTVVEHGMDFYQLARDGRISRVTGFFGPPPTVDTH